MFGEPESISVNEFGWVCLRVNSKTSGGIDTISQDR